jgi:hypothetical protein
MDGTSEVYNLRAGVPQESVLLFLVYVNDIADEVLGLCRLFADDNHYLMPVVFHDIIQSVGDL